MEAGTLDKDRASDVEPVEPGRGSAEIKKAVTETGAKSLTAQEQTDALAWLIGDDDEAEDVQTKDLTVNIGTYSQPRRIAWTIRNVDREVLKQLQREARGGNRAQRRGNAPAEVDPEAATLRIVSRGTVAPDLTEAARAKGIAEAPDPDYARMQILKWRFRNKPGLLDQLAGEIFDLSGYDDEAIQEAEGVQAAGN